MDPRVLFSTVALVAAAAWTLIPNPYTSATPFGNPGGQICGWALCALLIASAIGMDVPAWLYALVAIVGTIGAAHTIYSVIKHKKETRRIQIERQKRFAARRESAPHQ